MGGGGVGSWEGWGLGSWHRCHHRCSWKLSCTSLCVHAHTNVTSLVITPVLLNFASQQYCNQIMQRSHFTSMSHTLTCVLAVANIEMRV